VGYLITGVKDVRQSKVGDTITNERKPATDALPGYTDPKPMVFSGIYPIDGSDYADLREALDKLKLSDASLQYEPETSVALGFGFRCGFLGLLHLEIITERLARVRPRPHHDGAVGHVRRDDRHGRARHRHEPERVPGRPRGLGLRARRQGRHPAAEGLRRHRHGALPGRRGTLLGMDYLSEDRVELRYNMPLGEIVFDFFDQLKSKTQGYASLDYEPAARRRPISSRSTSCCRARRSTPSPRSSTARRPTRTAR
jgi:GTP-binding protein LepA